MKKVAFYGASDDLVEVEGDFSGCDEFPSDDATFTISGLKVRVHLTNSGVWAIETSQVDEDVPVEAQEMSLSVADRIDGTPGYSMRLEISVPDGAYVTKSE